MDDRELLELAAKAAGYLVQTSPSGNALISERRKGQRLWNPLTDDGDQMRLARTMRMTLAHEPMRGGWSAGAVVDGEFRWLAFNIDDRRAIVIAAAEIGRSIQDAPQGHAD